MTAALVTGSGKGIGRAIALELAAQGFDIAVNDLAETEETKKTIEDVKAKGIKACEVYADVSKHEEVAEMFAKARKELGFIEVLVCNAGVNRDTLLPLMKDADWQTVLDINLSSVFYCAKEAMRPMLKERRGRIIAVSSVAGMVGNPGQANYAAAKAGIIGFVKSLAKEAGSRGITVNAIAPGFIDTDMTRALPEKAREALISSIPLGRAGTAEDVAKAAAFLASGNSAYITGQVITVDGGMTMC